ncbi:single-stranded DNA-binding protein [Streptomyces prasinopilosus]|uniref:single-stranded DNA-binding protein n=1 Tax=Streptomyces prasinopilosus TaxID=67344 RepID=UPI0006EBC567|nr:single-stranded DNA-binding protein [Streptomyces prasinopilosus]
MSLPTLNGTARLIDAPELRFSAQGTAVVKVRLAFNSRKKDDAGQWVDADSFFIDGKVFGQYAQNLADSLEKGMEVVVSGRLRTEKWETREGEKRSAPSLLVDSIGPSLRFATARVEKAGGSGQGRQDAYRAAQQASSREGMEDPWTQPSPAGGGQAAGSWGGGSGGGYSDEPPF